MYCIKTKSFITVEDCYECPYTASLREYLDDEEFIPKMDCNFFTDEEEVIYWSEEQTKSKGRSRTRMLRKSHKKHFTK